MKYFLATFIVTLFGVAVTEKYEHASFDSSQTAHSRNMRATPDTSAADVMARNILEWIQNIYRSQNVRKTRQQADNAYLPPYTSQRPPEKPRPFQPASTQQPPYSNNGYSSSPVSTARPSVQAGFPSTSGYPYTPRPSPPFPGFSSSSSQASGSSGFPPTSTTYLPPPSGGYPSVRPTPSFPIQQPSGGPAPGPSPAPAPRPAPRPAPGPAPTPTPSPVPNTNVSPGQPDDDANHPPHIHNIEVQCSKTMMTINIEFNRAYDGLIYSKGFYMMPECRYVEANSGNTKYSFTVSMDSCGTQFINDFEGDAGQSYLENVLVLQNEPTIQEVWDTVRRVRCLWEGNINKALTVSLSVDMLNQEIVTFSGDTASAKLDIQIGKGPFAPAADGLVKIGETMTLVVSVEGDADFDLQVRDCIARDETSTNMVQLTDERGCILKPKIFGAFQKTKDTGNTGASLIAYAFFQAFKFPDVMDLFIECNVELCKTNCESCPEPNQQIDPGRRRRSVSFVPSLNSTANLTMNAVRVGRGFRVVMPDDLSPMASQALENVNEEIVQEFASPNNVCLSNSGFYAAFSMMFTAVVSSTISAIILYSKLQKIYRSKAYNLSVES